MQEKITMTAAKVINLRVRPLQASILACESDGIVGELNAKLGATVTAFNFATFYASLGATVTGSPAQLQFGSQRIHDDPAVTASNLLALRAEPLKAALDAAIAARANAYYAKYGNQDAIITKMQQYYSPTGAGSKPQLLADLSNLAQQQAILLQAAYLSDSMTGVVKTTTSSLGSTTKNTGGYSTETTLDEHAALATSNTGQTTTTGTDKVTGTDTVSGTDVAGSGFGTTWSPQNEAETNSTDTIDTTENISTSTDLSKSGSTGTNEITGTDNAVTTIDETASQTQTITNTGYDYRVPSIENSARNDRAQISLIDEQFAQFMAGQNLPYLQQVFGNELAMIDLGVKRLQVAYLNTIIMSPIAGVVTGIFTNLGNRIRAGGAIIRVENNQTVLIEGTVVYRDMVSLGQHLTVETTQFGDPSKAVVIGGPIVAACGHESEDDQWHITASCYNINEVTGQPIFPVHYNFDYDDTHADIVTIIST
ncbi:MAG TPA: hypothetical protein VIY52_25640 [Streptosporangiaceae bacterium]